MENYVKGLVYMSDVVMWWLGVLTPVAALALIVCIIVFSLGYAVAWFKDWRDN